MRQAASTRRALGLTACLGVLVLALGTAAPAAAQEEERPLPAPVPVAEDDLTEALDTGELTEAEYALERARSVFQLARARREFGDVEPPDPHDVTLILRDLALRVDDLAGADRTVAKKLLARPPQGASTFLPGNGWQAGAAEAVACGAYVCVHWVDSDVDPDAPPPEDVHPPIDVPDWVELVLQTWEDIWVAEINTLGYRVPLSDSASTHNGGDGTLDIYLEDLGSSGVFGYCTSDDPAAEDPSVWTVSAYCVIDNDFAEFGVAHTPEAFLQVTSAHEFHHASQFAYDWLEDYWMMEGTAANMEETVYPGIDDNVNFLAFWSPLSRPGSPLDRGGLGDSEYGSWIFWRFLEEKIAGDPGILREIWERAAPDDVYSLLAVTRELTQRGLPFRDAFAQFGTANRLGDYADAATAGYPVPPRSGVFGIGPNNRVIGWRSWRINHLATRILSFTPGSKASAGAKLRLEFRLPKHGTRATVAVLNKNGSTSTRRLNQNGKGFVRWGAPFGKGTVKRVEVVLTNGSTRIGGCWLHPGPPSTSCLGRPLDDNRTFRTRATLIG